MRSLSPRQVGPAFSERGAEGGRPRGRVSGFPAKNQCAVAEDGESQCERRLLKQAEMHEGRTGGRERGRRDRLLDAVPRPRDPCEVERGDVRYADAEKDDGGSAEDGARDRAPIRAGRRQDRGEADEDERKEGKVEPRVGSEEQTLADAGGKDRGRHESPLVSAGDRRAGGCCDHGGRERPPPFPAEPVCRCIADRAPASGEPFGGQEAVPDPPQQRARLSPGSCRNALQRCFALVICRRAVSCGVDPTGQPPTSGFQ
jgi:hypothetical protein